MGDENEGFGNLENPLKISHQRTTLPWIIYELKKWSTTLIKGLSVISANSKIIIQANG